MHRTVTHNAFLADFLASGLELRLYEADDIRIRLEKTLDCGKNELHRDKGHVHHGDIKKLRNLFLRHIAEVRALKIYDALVIPELPTRAAL